MSPRTDIAQFQTYFVKQRTQQRARITQSLLPAHVVLPVAGTACTP